MNLRSEIIDLASDGYFYPSSSKYSSGKINILPITAEHEELLCNINLAKRGLLENTFLNIVVDGGIDASELLQCDKESILLNLRIANYGAYSKMKIKCSDCDNEFEQDVSFAFPPKSFNFNKYTRGINELSYTFGKSKKVVKFRLATCNEYEIYQKRGWLAFAKAITNSIEGVEDINEFYEYYLSAPESTLFRKFYENSTPGYISDMKFDCPTCKVSKSSKTEVNTEIFAIRPESKMNIHSEIFDLCYYSNGAFTQDGVYKMPTLLRSFYIKKLVDAKQQESDANKAASEGKSGKANIARPPTVKK